MTLEEFQQQFEQQGPARRKPLRNQGDGGDAGSFARQYIASNRGGDVTASLTPGGGPASIKPFAGAMGRRPTGGGKPGESTDGHPGYLQKAPSSKPNPFAPGTKEAEEWDKKNEYSPEYTRETRGGSFLEGMKIGNELGQGEDPMFRMGAVLGAGIAGLFNPKLAGEMKLQRMQKKISDQNQNYIQETDAAQRLELNRIAIEDAQRKAKSDKDFQDKLDELLKGLEPKNGQSKTQVPEPDPNKVDPTLHQNLDNLRAMASRPGLDYNQQTLIARSMLQKMGLPSTEADVINYGGLANIAKWGGKVGSISDDKRYVNTSKSQADQTVDYGLLRQMPQFFAVRDVQGNILNYLDKDKRIISPENIQAILASEYFTGKDSKDRVTHNNQITAVAKEIYGSKEEPTAVQLLNVALSLKELGNDPAKTVTLNGKIVTDAFVKRTTETNAAAIRKEEVLVEASKKQTEPRSVKPLVARDSEIIPKNLKPPAETINSTGTTKDHMGKSVGATFKAYTTNPWAKLDSDGTPKGAVIMNKVTTVPSPEDFTFKMGIGDTTVQIRQGVTDLADVGAVWNSEVVGLITRQDKNKSWVTPNGVPRPTNAERKTGNYDAMSDSFSLGLTLRDEPIYYVLRTKGQRGPTYKIIAQ